MRVIAGSARSIPLVTLEGQDVRPTTDRIKETLFNILQNEVPASAFLDIFAGSGAIGIEALSRGADRAVFIDNSRISCECIDKNLQKTRLADKAEVMKTDALSGIERLKARGEHFDIIFMDPPYSMKLWLPVLIAIKGSPLVDEDTMIIIEERLYEDFDEAEAAGFEILREKRYKNQKHMFLKLRG